MLTLLKIKQEIKDFSGWFKIAFVVLFVVYISFWFFTINLHDIQKREQIEPVLPVIPEDSQGYELLSQSIADGKGFGVDGGIETLRTPGYPFFVAAVKTVGRSYFAVTLVQILLVFISAFFIRKIGIFFASKRVGEISALLFLINPVTLVLSLVILTDTLFVFLLTLGSYLALSINNEKIVLKTIALSVIVSLSVYIRLGLFSLPVFASLILASEASLRNKLKSVFITVFIVSLAVSPWVLRNYVHTGVASFNSFKAVNLAWLVPRFLSSLNGTSIEEESRNFEKEAGVPEANYQDIRFSGQISSAAEKIILDKPFSYLKYHIVSSVPFLFPSSIAFGRDVYNSAMHIKTPFKEGIIRFLTSGDLSSFFNGILSVWWKFAERICWLLIYIIAILGLWKDRKNPYGHKN